MVTKKSFKRVCKRAIKHARLITKAHPVLIFGTISFVALGGILFMQPKHISPAAYRPLLDTIASGESNGNYNAYYGNASNTDRRFTQMTIAEVLHWQKDYVDSGSPSNAVGRYQIIQPTLESLVDEMNLDTKDTFDEPTQDAMAIHLMKRRGAEAYIHKSLPAENFAHNLSKEWAALPKVIGDSPEASYYDGDGLNKSRVSSQAILESVTAFKNAAQ